jgi:hypothetical protein
MKTKHNERLGRLLQRAGQRRRKRGAAMVEGLVVIPFFMMMLGGTVFAGDFYTARIGLQMEARRDAWKVAMQDSCDGSSELENLEVVDSADLGDLASSPLSALCNKDFGVVKYAPRKTINAKALGSYGGGSFTGEAMGGSYVPCNETPLSGELAYEAAIEFLFEAYSSAGAIPPGVPNPTVSPFFGIVFPSGGFIF